MTRELWGIGAAARTNFFAYYTNGLLEYAVHENGAWEYYVYDEQSRPTHIFSSFGNQSLTTNLNLCRLTEHTYDLSVVSGSDDTGMFDPDSPRRTIEYLLGQEVSRRYQTFAYGETREIRCVTPGAAWNSSGNLVTITTLYTNGYFYGQPKSIEHPDGTMQFFQYFGIPGNTAGSTNIVLSGVPNSGKNDIVDGTRTVTIKGSLGELVSVETTDVKTGNSIVLSRALYGDYNLYSQPQAVTNLDGGWEYSQRFCCGDTVTTNREGMVITKTYDSQNRLLTTTSAGITFSNVYDPAGNLIKQYRLGSLGGVSVLQQNSFDSAGHMTGTTNADNEIKAFSRALSSAGEVTNITRVFTNSGAATYRYETYFRDGTLKSITGPMAHPVRYEYGPTTNGTYTKEIKLDASGADSSEWITTFYDMLGRPIGTEYPDGKSSQMFYNSKGQMTNQVDPDGVSTLTFNSPKGEPAIQVIDLNRNGVVDWDGIDRITWTTNYVTNNGYADVYRTETHVWLTNGQDSSTLLRVTDSAVNGLATWTTTAGLVSSSETFYPGDGIRALKITAPDGTYTLTTNQFGKVISFTRCDSGGTMLSQVLYAYDEHGRQKFGGVKVFL